MGEFGFVSKGQLDIPWKTSLKRERSDNQNGQQDNQISQHSDQMMYYSLLNTRKSSQRQPTKD